MNDAVKSGKLAARQVRVMRVALRRGKQASQRRADVGVISWIILALDRIGRDAVVLYK